MSRRSHKSQWRACLRMSGMSETDKSGAYGVLTSIQFPAHAENESLRHVITARWQTSIPNAVPTH